MTLRDAPLLVGKMVYLCPVKSSLPMPCPLPGPYKDPQITSADPFTMKMSTVVFEETSENLHYTAES
jgi:hypothetical protein